MHPLVRSAENQGDWHPPVPPCTPQLRPPQQEAEVADLGGTLKTPTATAAARRPAPRVAENVKAVGMAGGGEGGYSGTGDCGGMGANALGRANAAGAQVPIFHHHRTQWQQSLASRKPPHRSRGLNAWRTWICWSQQRILVTRQQTRLAMQLRVDVLAALRGVPRGPADKRAPPKARTFGSAAIAAVLPASLDEEYHRTREDALYFMRAQRKQILLGAAYGTLPLGQVGPQAQPPTMQAAPG